MSVISSQKILGTINEEKERLLLLLLLLLLLILLLLQFTEANSIAISPRDNKEDLKPIGLPWSTLPSYLPHLPV